MKRLKRTLKIDLVILEKKVHKSGKKHDFAEDSFKGFTAIGLYKRGLYVQSFVENINTNTQIMFLYNLKCVENSLFKKYFLNRFFGHFQLRILP